MTISKNNNKYTSIQLTEKELKALKFWVSGPEDGVVYPIIKDGLGELPIEWLNQKSKKPAYIK